MHLDRLTRVQLAITAVISVVLVGWIMLYLVNLPVLLFGVGKYQVTMQLAETGGLYARGLVNYRGVQVGRVESVRLTDTGVEAVLSLNSGVNIPSDLKAEVHSRSAIGEQYVELLPRNDTSAPLRNGDVISVKDTSVPPDINVLLADTNAALKALPNDNLKTVVDESYTAVGGLGPELSRIVKGGSTLAIDAGNNLDALVTAIDKWKSVVDTQVHTAGAIQAWASQVAAVTAELQTHDEAVAGIVQNGGPALGEARQLIERLQPTLPIVLANLVSVGQLALTYHDNVEQLLVLLPELVSHQQGILVANANTKQDYTGIFLSFNLNLNLPPACLTGFMPAQQMRTASFEDYPDRLPGELYCRTSQDSLFNVRGAKNLPCAAKPGKRAPTAGLCKSDEDYVPLNDGYNWKGDPNATLSGKDIPDIPPGWVFAPGTAPPAAPPIAAVEYDPVTGTYVGPDGRRYTQGDLAQTAPKEKTWQNMLTPPGN